MDSIKKMDSEKSIFDPTVKVEEMKVEGKKVEGKKVEQPMVKLMEIEQPKKKTSTVLLQQINLL